MRDLIAYKCLECGHYTIASSDGIRCSKCNGHLISQGKATYRENRQQGRALTVKVSIKETYVFEKMVRVFKALVDDEYTPKWIKEKINQLILDEL